MLNTPDTRREDIYTPAEGCWWGGTEAGVERGNKSHAPSALQSVRSSVLFGARTTNFCELN